MSPTSRSRSTSRAIAVSTSGATTPEWSTESPTWMSDVWRMRTVPVLAMSAVAPDGRVVVGEGAGRVRAVPPRQRGAQAVLVGEPAELLHRRGQVEDGVELGALQG